MAKSYTVAGVTYTTRKAFEYRIRRIIHRNCTSPLTDQDLEIADYLRKQHPRSDEIEGPGIAYYFVKVRMSTYFKPAPAITVHRVDGTEESFGYKNCLDPHRYGVDDVAKAARNAVKLDMAEFKKAYFAGADEAPCEICRELLHPGDADVHHVGTKFRYIANEFKCEAVVTKNEFEKHFKDPAVTELVRTVHSALIQDGDMSLQVVCRACNGAAERRSAA